MTTKVQCITNEAIYNVPDTWPNCTETVDCGIPPEKPTGGSITWLNGTEHQVLNTRKYIINFQNEIYLRVKTNIIRKNCTYNELMGLFVF